MKKILTFLGVIGFTALLPCAGSADISSSSMNLSRPGSIALQTDNIFKDYDFPSYPNLTHLCQKRVYSANMEIIWDGFASADTPAEIVKYYRQKLGNTGFNYKSAGGTWSLPLRSQHESRVLDILSVETDNPTKDCQKKPPADARTIIIVSRNHLYKK